MSPSPPQTTVPGDAGRLFREGNVTDALAAATAAVRKAPTDIGARVLMVRCARVSNEEWQTHVRLPFVAAPLESRSGNTDTEFCADAGFGEAILMTGCTGTTFQTWNIGA